VSDFGTFKMWGMHTTSNVQVYDEFNLIKPNDWLVNYVTKIRMPCILKW
jgi:hypothetical protein